MRARGTVMEKVGATAATRSSAPPPEALKTESRTSSEPHPVAMQSGLTPTRAAAASRRSSA